MRWETIDQGWSSGVTWPDVHFEKISVAVLRRMKGQQQGQLRRYMGKAVGYEGPGGRGFLVKAGGFNRFQDEP